MSAFDPTSPLEINSLTIEEVRARAAHLGMRVDEFWRYSIAPLANSTTLHYRRILRELAITVSDNIIPHQTVTQHARKWLENPIDKGAIPWKAWCDTYGVGRKYISLRLLSNLERALASVEDTLQPLPHKTTEYLATLTSMRIDDATMDRLCKEGKHPYALGAAMEYRRQLKGEVGKAHKIIQNRRREKEQEAKYYATSHAEYREQATANFKARLKELKDYCHATDTAGLSLKHAALLLFPRNTRMPCRPPNVAAVLFVIHKHARSFLSAAQLEAFNVQAEFFSRKSRPITRKIVVELATTGEVSPATFRL